MKKSTTAFPLRFLFWMALLAGAAVHAGCGSSSSSTEPPGTGTDSNWDSLTWDQSNWA